MNIISFSNTIHSYCEIRYSGSWITPIILLLLPFYRPSPATLNASIQRIKRSTTVKIIWNWKKGKEDKERKKPIYTTGNRSRDWVHNPQLVSNSVSLLCKESVLFLSKCLKKSSDILGEPLELIVFFNWVGASTLFNSQISKVGVVHTIVDDP